MASHSIVFPADFSDYATEVESKGWFADAKLVLLGKQYSLNFYDPMRLSQEIESELQRGVVFFERNLLVVQSVTQQNMENAVAQLVQAGNVSSLVAD